MKAGVILLGSPGMVLGDSTLEGADRVTAMDGMVGSFATAVLPTPVNFDRGTRAAVHEGLTRLGRRPR
jgi:hypothetical protein